MTKISPDDFAAIYKDFNASVSKFDCGKKCSPLNGGSPVCCSTQDAVPVVHKAEFKLLKGRTDLWKRFKPYDAATKKIVEELTDAACAIECKGAAFCERNNRTIACRAFPFYPYVTREKKVLGLSVYWVFEDRCWMMSNMALVERPFVDEFLRAFEAIFAKDEEEWETYVDFSASMRRVFSRWKRKIPVIGRDGGLLLVDPSTGKARPGGAHEYPKYGPFRTEAGYRRAIKEAKGVVPPQGLRPV
ncbi:MAG: hypothetical protein IPK81_05515 [Rhodospirillales bacterium]|nr:MAG: hypothetical protein IPK81_05515 [Rhodospirillales bacterium]